MRSRTTYLVIGAVAFLLCQAAVDQGTARVVRDSKAPASNPAVEAGGHRLPSPPRPQVAYSVLGGIEPEGDWIMQCALWPWRQFGSLAWFRHRGFRDERSGERQPPFVPVP